MRLSTLARLIEDTTLAAAQRATPVAKHYARSTKQRAVAATTTARARTSGLLARLATKVAP